MTSLRKASPATSVANTKRSLLSLVSIKLKATITNRLLKFINFRDVVTLKENQVNGTSPFINLDKEGIRYVRLIIWLFNLQPWATDMINLWNEINDLRKRNGTVFLVAYLKEANRLLMLCVAGSPGRSDPFGTIVRTANTTGVPSIIPYVMRREILAYNQDVIRGILTIFSMYRIISIPGKLKLSTITDKFNGLTQTLPQYEVE